MGKVITLDAVPSTLDVYSHAVAGMLPVFGKSGPVRPDAVVPDTIYRLHTEPTDLQRLQEYCRTTGMHLGSTLPLTYPFVLQFPLVMRLMTSREFPFSAIGSVHVENRIRRYRPISVTERLTISTQASNLREHRKGLLIDVTSRFEVGGELAYEQIGTFLSQQRTSLSDEERGRAPKESTPPPPDAVLSVNLGQIRNYAAASRDRNPIHMGNLPAKAFGFPRAIAHGMWSAAAAIANLDRQLPDAVDYQIRFGKPILLPAKVNLYTKRVGEQGDYDISILDPKKGFPHLTATTRAIT